MNIIEKLKSGKFVYLSEINPPKGTDFTEFHSIAGLVRNRVDALYVTDMQGAVMRMGSIAASCELIANGYDVLCNFSCRDRNVLALQGELLGAVSLGIKNIYITDGEDITSGDHPKGKEVYETGSDGLVAIAKKMQDGFDFTGNKLTGAPSFHMGTSLNSSFTGDAMDAELRRMDEAVNGGVDYFITPAVFDLERYGKFVKKVRDHSNIPVLSELILLKSVATARFINKHVANINVPELIIERLQRAGDKQLESIAITSEIISGLREICQGVVIIPLGWEMKLPVFLEAIGI